MQERLNCIEKKRLRKTSSHFDIVSLPYSPQKACSAICRIFSGSKPKRMK